MAEARKLIRPLTEQNFVHQLKDTRKPIVFTYIRRPGYYAAFASAPKQISAQQRLGLTFVWTPAKGVLLQSQTAGSETAWGTSEIDAKGMNAEYLDGGATIRYPLEGGGHKQLVFAPEGIHITVERPGAIVENIPVFNPACVVSTQSPEIRPQDPSIVLHK
jgi:hypothetical protein